MRVRKRKEKKEKEKEEKEQEKKEKRKKQQKVVVVMVRVSGIERQNSKRVEAHGRGGVGWEWGGALPGTPKGSCQLKEEPRLKGLNGVRWCCSGEYYSVHSHGLQDPGPHAACSKQQS